MSQFSSKTRKPSSPLLHRNAKKTSKQMDETAYPQRPNNLSWKRAHQKASPYYQLCHNLSTVFSTRATQPYYNQIAPRPMQITIYTFQRPSAKPSFRDASW